MRESEAVPAAVPGADQPSADNGTLEWISGATQTGRTITAAIPPVFTRYATVVVPDGDTAKTAADAALVAVLAEHTPEQLWWLGYLDTGVADLVEPGAPRTYAYAGWPYVLLEGGPEVAMRSRRNADVTPWHSAFPELAFPADRSWLVSTLWDDNWRCVGGPSALIDALLRRPELDVREVGPDVDAAPPGHTNR